MQKLFTKSKCEAQNNSMLEGTGSVGFVLILRRVTIKILVLKGRKDLKLKKCNSCSTRFVCNQLWASVWWNGSEFQQQNCTSKQKWIKHWDTDVLPAFQYLLEKTYIFKANISMCRVYLVKSCYPIWKASFFLVGIF